SHDLNALSVSSIDWSLRHHVHRNLGSKRADLNLKTWKSFELLKMTNLTGVSFIRIVKTESSATALDNTYSKNPKVIDAISSFALKSAGSRPDRCITSRKAFLCCLSI